MLAFVLKASFLYAVYFASSSASVTAPISSASSSGDFFLPPSIQLYIAQATPPEHIDASVSTDA